MVENHVIKEVSNHFIVYFRKYERDIMKQVTLNKIKGDGRGYRLSYKKVYQKLVKDNIIREGLTKTDRFMIKYLKSDVYMPIFQNMTVYYIIRLNNKIFNILNNPGVRSYFLQENIIQIDFEEPPKKGLDDCINKDALKAIGFLIK